MLIWAENWAAKLSALSDLVTRILSTAADSVVSSCALYHAFYYPILPQFLHYPQLHNCQHHYLRFQVRFPRRIRFHQRLYDGEARRYRHIRFLNILLKQSWSRFLICLQNLSLNFLPITHVITFFIGILRNLTL